MTLPGPTVSVHLNLGMFLLYIFYFSTFLVFHVSVLHSYTVTSSVLCSMLVAMHNWPFVTYSTNKQTNNADRICVPEKVIKM